MPRQSRVLSFISTFSTPKSPTLSDAPQSPTYGSHDKLALDTGRASMSPAQRLDEIKASPSPTSHQQQQQHMRSESRASTRPQSMMQTYSPTAMDVSGDTLPELQPIFAYLNSHSNKLYQEGYFLKLHDLDSRGRPSTDRTWTECFAQLVGTVLSLWDAAALDAAGEDGEVVPTFINLSDASIKMIESLPMNGTGAGSLQNVLSVSTAANNRYLLHFNSLNSLTQWTAGIRLAMYECATLQEAYTGSLIAGKGKLLNNIRAIMDRSKFKSEDWARVRFGAGTPWRRCWCVITPPDEKEYQKAQKTLKKKNTYDRKIKVPKGDIKFYDTRKITKKTKPIATISDTYAAYAIYPQSKPLIDQSTLVKLEGLITIHTTPETTTEGFVFVMPEVHPAVTGFEMMLRWLFPVFDTFALYGRPNRLIADTLDQRGLMFAMPRDRRYGYLDILDVSGLIHTEGSQAWSERQWRVELKKLTSHRMNAGEDSPLRSTRERRNTTSRTSLPSIGGRGGVRFDDDGSSHSQPVTRGGSPAPSINNPGPRRAETPPMAGKSPGGAHQRSVSDAVGYKKYQSETPSRLSHEQSRGVFDEPPPPPAHGVPMGGTSTPAFALARVNSEPESPPAHTLDELNLTETAPPVTPVANPPAFLHNPNSRPANQPYAPPELIRANSAMDAATLLQLKDATRRDGQYENGNDQYGTIPRHEVAIDAKTQPRMPADVSSRKGVVKQLRVEQRLPTIPASPPPSSSVFSQTTPTSRAVAPPVPQHSSSAPLGPSPLASFSQIVGATDRTVSPSRSIVRKPVPQSVQSPLSDSEAHIPSSPSSVGSGGLSEHLIDQEALERVLQGSYRNETMTSGTNDSVDYASTKSASPKKSVERPRTGRLKTVGDPSLEADQGQTRSRGRFDTFHEEAEAEESGAVPNVDFGPTFTYKPNPHARPSSRGALTPGAMTAAGQEGAPRPPPHTSPAEDPRSSYFGAKSPDEMQDNRRSVAWRPGSQSPGPNNPGQSLTPEQWVQYRATMASQPVNPPRVSPVPGHHRQPSMTTPGNRNSSASTPPISRTNSGDWTQQVQRTPPQTSSRRNSFNASLLLNQPNPGGPSESRLTAREQMQVSRATGSPLVNAVGNDNRMTQVPPAGLMGAMEAREREKQAAKEGLRSGMVQQAIALRQQQQQQQQAQAQAQAQAQMQAQYYRQQQVAHAQAYSFQQQAYANPAHMQQQLPAAYQQYNQRPGIPQQGSSSYYNTPQQQGARNSYIGPHVLEQGNGWADQGSQQQYGRQYLPGDQHQQRQQQPRYR